MRKMLKVMLTEDGSETLHELAGILRSNNCEVSTVIKDGTQIVEKLKSGEVPDVLLMDGFMSRLDALGVLRELGAMRLERRLRPEAGEGNTRHLEGSGHCPRRIHQCGIYL